MLLVLAAFPPPARLARPFWEGGGRCDVPFADRPGPLDAELHVAMAVTGQESLGIAI